MTVFVDMRYDYIVRHEMLVTLLNATQSPLFGAHSIGGFI